MLYVRELCVTMLMCERVLCDRGMCGRVMCDSGVVREFCVIMVLCDRVVCDNRVVLHSCTTDPCVTRILCDVLMCVCVAEICGTMRFGVVRDYVPSQKVICVDRKSGGLESGRK